MLSSTTMQRVLLVAVLTASKFLEDTVNLNTRWCVNEPTHFAVCSGYI